MSKKIRTAGRPALLDHKRKIANVLGKLGDSAGDTGLSRFQSLKMVEAGYLATEKEMTGAPGAPRTIYRVTDKGNNLLRLSAHWGPEAVKVEVVKVRKTEEESFTELLLNIDSEGNSALSRFLNLKLVDAGMVERVPAIAEGTGRLTYKYRLTPKATELVGSRAA